MSNQCSILPASPVEDSKKISKLAVDLSTRNSTSGHVDEPDQIDGETVRLINELLTRVGALMEDTINSALLRDSCGGSAVERVRILEMEITRMKLIAEAAKSLLNG